MKKNWMKKCVIVGMLILFVGAAIHPSISGNLKRPITVEDENNVLLPLLPRWREGGTPHDPNQWLYPYAIQAPKLKDVPTSGLIESPPEYDPTHGVIFWYQTGHWTSVVRDCVVALTEDDQYDEIAYVVVTSTSQMNSAINAFTAGGANMSKVEFFIEPGNSVWLRDYGPHFIWQNGSLCIVDSHYYPTRSLDNFNPTLLGDNHFLVPTYALGLYYSGGNFQPGPNRTGFVTSLVNLDNPSSAGFDEAFIAELYQTYQGIDTLHVMPKLPSSVDGTGHIDMWMNIIDEDTVIISEFIKGSNPTAIQITDDATIYMQNLGFEVYRTPAWNANHPDNGYPTHWTYTNAFRVNDRIFIPTFGETYPDYADEDAAALAAFEAAAGPDVDIVQINCYPIIWAAGAIHCIVMQVPRYTAPEPAVHVISPCGGELLVSGTTETIQWTATDTNNTVIPQIDLYYSVDGGDSYEFIDTTTDTGLYDWTVPYAVTEQAKIKVVATSADMDQTEAESTDVFQIALAQQTIYDFSTDAGVDKFGYGYQTSNWNSYIDGDRTPVTAELSPSSYTRLAHSDATGGDNDINRYISPNPSCGYESTHTFGITINEDPAEIDDIEILWEGYADHCTQAELYVWDYVEGQWSDGEGLFGQNRFMDNWAGNHDSYLEKHIRSNFERYIALNGQMTVLLYAERGTFYASGWYYIPTFHDYIAITISDILIRPPEIIDVEATPFIQEIDGWINISCNVTSLTTINQVNINITFPDNSTINQSMSNILGTDTYYYNNNYSLSGTYDFFIWANDTSGNANSSDVYQFHVGVICGDANYDEIVDVADVVYLINYLFRNGAEPQPALCAGDCNNDDIVDVADVVFLINYLFRSGAAPAGCCY
jgi:agmatine deiminase